MKLELSYIEDRKIDLEDSTKESLIELVLNLELFLLQKDEVLFDEFYGE